jgi:hypothetical protein
VRFIDASPVFRVIYDAVNSTLVTLDLVNASVILRAVYAYDGAPVSGGVICLSDSGTAVCASTNSTGYVVVSFNRFANGTVSYLNATDSNALVYTTLLAPKAPIAVKSVSPDLHVSIISTTNATYTQHLELPGLVKVVAEITGNASIYVNTTLQPVLVKVNGTPYSFSYVSGVVLLYNLGSLVEVYYSTPTVVAAMPGAAPVGAVYEVGFADNATITNATLRVGVVVNSTGVYPVLYYNGIVYRGKEYAGGLSYPLVVAVSWACEGRPEVSYMLVYMLYNTTYSVASRYTFPVNTTCPEKLYPYITAVNTAGIVDKYAGVLSDVLRYLGSGVLRLVVTGPVPAGGIVRYITLSYPVKIVRVTGGVSIEPGSGSTVTLVGFKGYTLGYSVAGVTVSNIVIGLDEYRLDLPLGISVMVVVDPSTRAVSIVQVAPLTPPTKLAQPSRPPVYVPEAPMPPEISSPSYSMGAPEFIVLYGSAVAVAVVASRLTGSVVRGVLLSGLSYSLVLLGIGALRGDVTAVEIATITLVVCTGAEIARRQAGVA